MSKLCRPQNGGGDTDGDSGGDGGGNEAQDPYLRAELRLYQDIMKAKTNDEFQAAIHDAAPVNYDSNPQLAPAGAPSGFNTGSNGYSTR